MTYSINNSAINFKTNEQNSGINYIPRKTAPKPNEQSLDDLFILQKRVEQEKAKKEKNKEKWNKAGITAQIVLAASFATMATVGLLAFIKQNGKGGVTKLDFEDIVKKVNFPSLEDDCVNPKVREFIKNIKNNSGLSKEVREVSGAKNSEQFLLMYGPPGTGKTFSAKMMAKELGAEYAEVQFADVSSPYIGQTSVEIKKIFNTLSQKAEKEPNKKFLVAFNEIDALLVPREKCGSNNLHLAENRTAFLNGLDQISKFKNVKLVGTTNVDPASGNLDKASLSRFGNMLEITLPTQKEILAALKFHLKKDATAIEKHKFFEKNSSAIDKFVQKLHDNKYSQRDIEKLSEDAHNRFGIAIKETKDAAAEKFDIKYLEEAFNAKGATTGTIDAYAGMKPMWEKIEEPTEKLPVNKKVENWIDSFLNFFRRKS